MQEGKSCCSEELGLQLIDSNGSVLGVFLADNVSPTKVHAHLQNMTPSPISPSWTDRKPSQTPLSL